MMATERNKSVIAKLMGLDDVPSKQKPVYRQQRVLSHNYLQKSASIGSHENRSSKVMQKNRPINKRNSTSQTSEIEERNFGNVTQASKRLFLVDSRTTFGWEFKKHLLERSKRTKVFQENLFSKRACDLDETPSKLDFELKQSSKLRKEVVIRGNEGWKNKSVTKLPIFKRFNISSSYNTKFKKRMKGDLKPSYGGHNNNVSTNSKDAEFSCPLDVSFEQDSLCENGFTSLNCINIDNELPRSVGEAYQPSPNSVLEPDNSSGSECGENVSTDLHGLWMKLEILKSESEENQSKPETVTLSDEDATERSFFSGQNTEPIRCFGPKEGQQFSYLVNVLNELRFHGGNVEIRTERYIMNRAGPALIMNPLIFETLEKKYEKQKSWNKADRKLLFDRVTLGLTELVWSKPLRRKMSTFLRRDIIEEELWNMLLNQQKEVNAALSEKASGKEPWLELTDEMDSMVAEIVAFLFEKLATELIVI